MIANENQLFPSPSVSLRVLVPQQERAKQHPTAAHNLRKESRQGFYVFVWKEQQEGNQESEGFWPIAGQCKQGKAIEP